MILVLDASMTIAAIFEDEANRAAQGVIRMVGREGATVPSLWRLEIANVLRNSIRRGRCDVAFADRALRLLSDLPIAIDLHTDIHAWGATVEISRQEDLTLYDAAYLEPTVRLGATLASCDRDLVAAARRRGLDVLTA
ncbi:type II toxin-antitoxin system VapC family toxin [Caulobacter sp.]|uniref:type II toxin-antitoxin system VapC family toxin n=1 Tax=Caulobacter sp. TaxID=78 RepID=UPI003BAC9148